jgi:hypothetical protein
MCVVNFETKLCKIPVWSWDVYVLYQFLCLLFVILVLNVPGRVMINLLTKAASRS